MIWIMRSPGAPALLRARAAGSRRDRSVDARQLFVATGFRQAGFAVNQYSRTEGKLIGVTQFGSGGDTFFRAALRKTGIKENEVTILQMGGTPGVAQGLESGTIEVGVLGDSGMLLVFRGMVRPLKGASSRELGFRGIRCAADDHGT